MKLANTIAGIIKRNSTLLLSSTAVVGVVSTAYLASRASVDIALERPEPTQFYTKKDFVRDYWKRYIPAVASGAVTIGCIVGSTKIGNKRAMAAQAAFILTERAYSEYREKVIDEFGEKKDEKIRELIAIDKVKDRPPSGEIIIVGGNILCCELYTMRYFQSDIETLRKAMNDFNAMLISQDSATLEEWYYLIGLQPTEFSSDVGWNSDKMMKLEFSSVLTDDGRPCLAFSYNHVRTLYEGMYKD